MPNLRTLKKLSKRAAPLVAALGDEREQFRAEPGENYTKSRITARKHWDRMRCHPSHQPKREDDRIYYRTRKGHIVCLSAGYVHPRKGTIMVGAVSGYYDPEWDEETAWDALRDAVHWYFMEYDEKADMPRATRDLSSPSKVFAAAADMIRERTLP